MTVVFWQEEQFLESMYAALGSPLVSVPNTKEVADLRTVVQQISGQPVVIKKGKIDTFSNPYVFLSALSCKFCFEKHRNCLCLVGRRVRVDLEVAAAGWLDSLVAWLPADWLGVNLPRANQRTIRPSQISWDLSKLIYI